MPDINPGVRVPTSNLDWKLANDFFDGALPIGDVNNKPIKIVVSQMSSIYFDYFHRKFGPINNLNSSHLVTEYEDYSKPLLKSSLQALKVSNGDLHEIRYDAKALRLQLRNGKLSSDLSIDHDKQIHKNFWSYVKQHIKLCGSLPPTFDSSSCTQAFCSFFSSINPSKSFPIPSWIPAQRAFSPLRHISSFL